MATTDSSLVFHGNGALDRLRPFAIVACSAAISGVSIATAFVQNGVNEYGWRAAVQYSGRVGVLLFLVPFLSGPIARLFRIRSLLLDRRAYGLGFAVAFAMYLGTVIAPYLLNDEPIPSTVLMVWSVGMALVTLQALTSNTASIRTLGFKMWSRLHTFAMYAYWIAFTVGFLDRVVGPSRPDNFMQIGLSLMVAALLVRFAASFAAKIGWRETAHR